VSSAVLDSSAVLAVFRGEPGAAVVLAALAGGAMLSAVNLAEVVTKLQEGGIPDPDIAPMIDQLHLVIMDLDQPQAYSAGFLRRQTRAAGLSLGDRVCLALAQQLGLPILTADRAWTTLNVPVTVTAIR
jgi:ribonuclease VapC